jgi:hypothetical protein
MQLPACDEGAAGRLAARLSQIDYAREMAFIAIGELRTAWSACRASSAMRTMSAEYRSCALTGRAGAGVR